jgi:membrane protease YdiL (CAAX protease family)
LGALLAPPLYWIGRSIPAFTDVNFQRFFNRAVLLAALALLWPLCRWLKIRGVNDLGLSKNPRPGLDLSIGLVLALGSMAALGCALLSLKSYELRTSLPWRKLAMLPITAAVVAIVEEAFFRGALQGLVQRSSSKLVALVFVAALFSILHFLKPEDRVIDQVSWISGLTLLPDTFRRFTQPAQVLGGFTTLFLVGLLLGFSRMRTASLWMPIGLHAGWIIGKMGFSKITRHIATASPWFGSDLLVGAGPLIVLAVTGLIMIFYFRNGRAQPASRRI